MRELLSPKQVARALQVSESSVKRWCDKGCIPTTYTEGGHRRIRISDLVEFVRRTDHEVVTPEAIGMPLLSAKPIRELDEAVGPMTAALLSGDEARSIQIALDLYLAEHSFSSICDDVIAAAFHQIGELWACGQAEIYQERRGCTIAERIIHELRPLIRPISSDAPLAIGCSASGDSYSLATTMAELVLREARWNACSLGENLPLSSVAKAIVQHRPRMVWISCSHIERLSEFLAEYRKLHEEFSLDVAFVVGGRALTPPIRKQMKYAAHCESMRDLEGFAQSLLSYAA